MRGQHNSRPKLPCRYCGQLTKSLYQVCLDHDDLLDLDQAHPAALETAGRGSSDELPLPAVSSAAPSPSLQGRSRSGSAALAPTTTGG